MHAAVAARSATVETARGKGTASVVGRRISAPRTRNG
jgi:hypothetical protein